MGKLFRRRTLYLRSDYRFYEEEKEKKKLMLARSQYYSSLALNRSEIPSC